MIDMKQKEVTDFATPVLVENFDEELCCLKREFQTTKIHRRQFLSGNFPTSVFVNCAEPLSKLIQFVLFSLVIKVNRMIFVEMRGKTGLIWLK